MFDQNQPQISPQITAIYQKMIRGILLVARYTFILTGYPKIVHDICDVRHERLKDI